MCLLRNLVGVKNKCNFKTEVNAKTYDILVLGLLQTSSSVGFHWPRKVAHNHQILFQLASPRENKCWEVLVHLDFVSAADLLPLLLLLLLLVTMHIDCKVPLLLEFK